MNAPAQHGYLLSHPEFDVCREVLGIEEFPVVLRLPSPGATHEERRRIVRSGLDGLRSRGLADDRGLHPGLAGLLQLLARPAAMVDARVLGPQGRRFALGGMAAGTAGVAVIDSGGVRISETSPYRLAAEVAAVAGPGTAGPGESVSVPTETLLAVGAAAGTDPRRLTDGLLRAGVDEHAATVLVQMCTDIGGRGQFGAEAVGPQGGARHRASRVVAFHDTPQGRYLQLRRAGYGGGPEWSTITPCSPAQLSAQIQELLDEVRTAHRSR
ncbi:MAG TPA: ESX secretion-associated protein EspG [Pseudonocardiaceae bacterium]|nr:ESX secretion-associated protein EspG [Pseudonocardiaceae bacterium]